MKYMWKKDETKNHPLWDGAVRRMGARSKDLLTAVVKYEVGGGSIEKLHTHTQSQITYVISGKFIFSVNGEKFEVEAGDSLVNPPNLPHGSLCLEEGELLDVFTPNRPDIVPEDEVGMTSED